MSRWSALEISSIDFARAAINWQPCMLPQRLCVLRRGACVLSIVHLRLLLFAFAHSPNMATRVSAKCMVLGDKMYVGTHMHGPNHGLILYALLDVDCTCRCHNLCLRDHALDACSVPWQVWQDHPHQAVYHWGRILRHVQGIHWSRSGVQAGQGRWHSRYAGRT